MTNPTHLYCGKFDDVAAEISVDEVYRAKYVVAPVGEDQFCVEQCDTKADVKAVVKAYQRQFPGIIIVNL